MGRNKRQPTPDEIIASFGTDETALALHLRTDPVAFARHVGGLNPHPAQAEFLNLPLATGNMHVMLPWGRQYGKSTIVYLWLAWFLFSQPNASAYLFAPSGDQTKEIFSRIVHLYETNPFLKRYMPASPQGQTLFVGSKEWNSKVELVKVGLTGDLGRGRTTSGKGVIVFDEFAQFLYAQQVRGSLTPIIASGGSEIVLSSPGDPGSTMHRLYETWTAFQADGNPKYRVIGCDWRSTHLTAEWVEDQKREHEAQGTGWIFEREILGRWVAPANTWFDHSDISRCVLPVRPAWKPGDQFVWAVDMSQGGKSALVIAVARFNQALSRLEVIDLRSFLFENHKYRRDTTGSEVLTGGDEFEQIVEICCDLRDTYGSPLAVMLDPNTERSLWGRLEKAYHFAVDEIQVGGYDSKLRFLNSLRKGIQEARLVWADDRITRQLQSFCPRKDEASGRWKFPDANTDIVVAMGNLYQYLGRMELSPFEVATGKRQTGGAMALW